MGLARFRLGTERRHATRWIGALFLIALAVTAALLAAQAARRTETAFARGLATGNASNAVVSANALGSNPAQTVQLREHGMHVLDNLDRAPIVTGHGRFGGITLYRVVNGQVDHRLDVGSAFGLVAYDNVAGRTIETLRLHSGRLADPERSDEITISSATARTTGWRVGTHVSDLFEFDVDAYDFATGTPRLDRAKQLSLNVVGIGELPNELLLTPALRVPRVFLTPAFQRRYPNSTFYINEMIRLRPGTGVTALRAAVGTSNLIAPDVGMTVAPTDDGLGKVESANDPLIRGLWAIAALAALVGLFLVAQSLGQSLATRADDHAQFRALGATRRQRLSMEVPSLLLVALGAALVGALLGFLFSPLTPIGAARDAEPRPGMSIDVGLTVAAIALTVVGVLVAALPALLRLVNSSALPGPAAVERREQRSHIADLEARRGLGVPAVVGTRLAFQAGRGRTATPVRSVLASLILVIAAVTATVAFGTNLGHWTITPRLYGWNWSAAVGSNFGAIPPEAQPAVEHFPNVTAASALNVGTLTVAGHAIPAIGIDRLWASLAPDINAGRLPNDSKEIVFGARTLRRIHAHIGDHVQATVGTTQVDLTIVGTTTFPAFGNERFGETGLGTGALGTASLFPVHDESVPDGRYNYLLLRFAPGTEAAAAHDLRAHLAKEGCADTSCVMTDSRPAEIDGYRNARGLPLVIGIVLILFLVATLVHALVSTMRRRTSDLAVLRALGCTPRELVAALRWQGLVLTVSALVVGIPSGLVAGHLAWSAFASRIGIAPNDTLPGLTLLVGIVALIAITTAVAAIVGSRVPSTIRRHRFAAS